MKKFVVIIIIIILAILIYLTFTNLKKNSNFENSPDAIETISTENIPNSDINNYILSQDTIFREKTIQEWETLAFNFYERNYQYRPSHAESYYNENNNLIINLYDVFNDHRSSCEWYEINKDTGITTNILLEEIDLVNENI